VIRLLIGCFAAISAFGAQATYYDTETSVHYNYFRDYDSGIGRYVQSDPLGVAPYRFAAQQLNHPYGYAANDPLTYVDPFGLCPCAGGVWDQEFGDFQFNMAAGGYVALGNVNFICRSDRSLKCSGNQLSIGAGTPNLSFNWALGGVVYGADDSSNLSGWSGSGLFSGWNLGVQGGIFQGQISLSGQGGGTAIGLPRGLSAALFKSLNYSMQCTCPECLPQ
jgi:RHS repeat-associated protein